jgi:ATP-binding cassette subfamily E protein 1
MKQYSYPSMTKTMERDEAKFILHVDEGEFTDSEIIVLLGENGTGKKTLSRFCVVLFCLVLFSQHNEFR